MNRLIGKYEINHRHAGITTNTFVIGLACVSGLAWVSLAPYIAMIPRGAI